MNEPAQTAISASQVQALATELRVWDAVAVVGAGTSVVPGLPLTGQLYALVYYAIDSAPGALEQVATALGRDPAKSAKAVIGTDHVALMAAFESIAAHSEARRAFQCGFAQLNAERLHRPSPAHRALAELLHRRVVASVISLNWDTRLEAAYKDLYGCEVPPDLGWLEKPHGDAAYPDVPWVLPHQPGSIPDRIVDNLEAMARDRPRVLLIVGYSEADEVVVERVVAPLASRWRVSRVGHGTSGELAICGSAEDALPSVVTALGLPPEVPGWEYIDFRHQRDIGWALAGRRLGPADAAVCPELPELASLMRLVGVTGSALLVGDTGTGKSVTCYQAGLDYSHRGWEVLRLSDALSPPPQEVVSALRDLPRRTLAIVDNAQRLPTALLQRLLEQSSPDLHVVAASTVPLASFGQATEIAAGRAVGVLAGAFRQRRDEILPIVRALDGRIGEGYMDESLEARIDHAEKAAKSPWEFNFTLAGGWRRAKDDVVVLRDHGRADVLLAAVAARQIATEDAAVPPDWLEAFAEQVGRDRAWVENATNALVERRAVLPDQDHAVRCPHGRFAELVLREVFRLPKDECWRELVTAVRSAILAADAPLRGVFRLLFDLCFAEAFPWHAESIVDDEALDQLIGRCWSPEEKRGTAGYLLMALLRWRRDAVLAELEAKRAVLARWITSADSDVALGLGSLVNDIYNKNPALAAQLSAASSPTAVARALEDLPLREWVAWDRLVNILAMDEAWRRSVKAALGHDAVLATAAEAQVGDVAYVSYLIKIVARVDRGCALDVVRSNSATMAAALNSAPKDSFVAIQDVVWFVLGFAPGFLRSRKPGPAQRRVAREIVRALDCGAIAVALGNAERRDWKPLAEFLFWVDEVDSRIAGEIVATVDLEPLDDRAEGLWATMPRELINLLAALARPPDWEPSRSWLLRHASDLDQIGPTIAIISPKSVRLALHGGKSLQLDVASGLGWKRAAAGLASLAEVDHELAIRTIRSNTDAIVQGLALPQADKCDGLVEFLDVLDEVDSEAGKMVANKVDPASVEENWISRLQGRTAERRAVRRLVELCAASDGAVGELAMRLRRRCPSLRKQ